MQLSSIFPPPDLLEQVVGVESGLRQSNRIRSFGRLGVAISAIQLTILILTSEWWQNLETFDWSLLVENWVVIFSVLVLVFFILLASWSRFWLKESQAPFRYTLSVSAFRPLTNTAVIEDKMAWLEHDLLKRLYERITRLSLLDEHSIRPTEDEANGNGIANKSHIHISGHYVVRKSVEGRWLIEVMPRVRIGGADQTEALAHVERFFLDYERPSRHAHGVTGTEEYKVDGVSSEDDPNQPPRLNERQYERVIERVYSSVATEIYRQIRQDVQRKIDLLPSNRYKFAAYFYEAEDYAHSNTIDAYDEAEKLYATAISLYPSWPRQTPREIMMAKAEIGRARMLIYRRTLALLSGRLANPVFEARRVAERAVSRLEDQPAFVAERNASLFDAYVILALAYAELGATTRANSFLERAKRLDPARTETEAIYLYVVGQIENRLASRLQYFRRAVELDPKFEIAQFQLAINAEMVWRGQHSLEQTLGEMVIEEYEQVLRLNPSNIGAWANIGYICWLFYDLEHAKDAFEYGRDYKAIRPDISVAELDYGLARLALETGEIERAYEHYVQAVSTQFTQGIWRLDVNFSSYYFDYINIAMLDRVRSFREAYEAALDQGIARISPQITRSVHAFVLNDYGEACMNYYIRTRDHYVLQEAETVLRQAVESEPQFTLAHFNLALLARWSGRNEDSERYLAKVLQLEPYWTPGMTFATDVQISLVRELPGMIESLQKKIAKKQKEIQGLDKKVQQPALEPHTRNSLFARLATSARAQQPSQLEPRTPPTIRPFDEGKGANLPDMTPETAHAKTTKLEREIEEYKKERERLEKDLNDRRQTIIKPVRYLLPHDFLRQNGEELIDISGIHVPKLLDSNTIRWETDLNEIHVRAMRQWANVLSERTEDIRALKAGLRLYKHIIQKFYPEHFETLHSMQRLATILDKRDKTELEDVGLTTAALNDLRSDCQEQLRTIVINSLLRDPGHMGVMDWLDEGLFIPINPAQKLRWWKQKQLLLLQAQEGKDVSNALRFMILDKLLRFANSLDGELNSSNSRPLFEFDQKDAKGIINIIRERAYNLCRQISASLDDAESIADLVRRVSSGRFYDYIEAAVLFLWLLKEIELVGTFLEKFAGQLDQQNTTWRGSLTSQLIRNIETPDEYEFLKTWLAAERRRGLQASSAEIVENTTSAQMDLVRACYIRFATNNDAQLTSIYPVVTPIALEADSALFPEGKEWSNDHIMFTRYIPDMRQRIKDKTGIDLPGVRVRANDTDFSPGEYLLIVDEVPIVMGTVYHGRRFYPHYAVNPPPLKPNAQAPIEAYNPVSGKQEGAWIRQSDVTTHEQDESWDRFDFFIRHLEVVIEQRILKFFTWQQYEDMLAAWSSASEANRRQIDHLLPDRAAKLKLFQAWRRLLYEQIYIDVETAIALFKMLAFRHHDVFDLVEAMRFEVRERLPGNESGRTIIPLSESFEAEIAESINEDRLFAIEPETAQNLLYAFHDHVRQHEGAELAVVVNNVAIRPYLRRLIELEYPAIPVLSYRELIGNFEMLDLPVPYESETASGQDETNHDYTATDGDADPPENLN